MVTKRPLLPTVVTAFVFSPVFYLCRDHNSCVLFLETDAAPPTFPNPVPKAHEETGPFILFPTFPPLLLDKVFRFEPARSANAPLIGFHCAPFPGFHRSRGFPRKRCPCSRPSPPPPQSSWPPLSQAKIVPYDFFFLRISFPGLSCF